MSYKNKFLTLTFEVPKVKHSPTHKGDGFKCMQIQTYIQKGVITLRIDFFTDVIKTQQTLVTTIFGQHVFDIVHISEFGYSKGSVHAMEACGGDRLYTALKGAILYVKRQWDAPYERRKESIPDEQQYAFNNILQYCDKNALTLMRRLTQKTEITHIFKPEGLTDDK